MRTQLADQNLVGDQRGARHDVRDEALAGIGVDEHASAASATVRMPAQHGFDLRRLDAVAVDLDLFVATSEIVVDAARVGAHAIAGAIPTLAGQGHETFGGQVRTMDVAGSEAVAAEQQFAVGRRVERAQLGVDDAHAHVRQRAADRRQFGHAAGSPSSSQALTTCASVGP